MPYREEKDVQKMNTMQRMRKTNQIFRAELEKMGYYDMVMFPHTRYFKDVWGLWDGVCKEPVGVNTQYRVVWLQFKTGYASNEDKMAMQLFCKSSLQKGMLCELVKRRKKYKNKKGSYTERVIKITEMM